MSELYNGHLKVSLKEYIETKLVALEKATEEAKSSLEKRLEGMNEFRAQLKDQTSTFITRVEFDALKESFQKQIIFIIISGIGFVITVVGIILGLMNKYR
jgi:cysteine sulfinate desulfinase/cysteine desulfurase-like protein